MTQSLTGKKALVTGASKGIGRAIALMLAERGAQVCFSYVGDPAPAEETLRMLREAGVADPRAFDADVSDGQAVRALAKEVGTVDILINNAGITADRMIGLMREEDFDKVIAVNLKGAFLMTKAFSAPMLRQRSGRIINMASVIGVMGNAGQANYAASKAGLIGLTKSAAREFAPRGVTVNAIAPGYIDTDMTRVLPDDVKAKMIGQIPLGVIGTPEDVAGVCCFLAGEDAKYITGQVIHVDGGMVM